MDLRPQDRETADNDSQRKENVEMAPHPNGSSAPPFRFPHGGARTAYRLARIQIIDMDIRVFK
jgi:hypothetical protein